MPPLKPRARVNARSNGGAAVADTPAALPGGIPGGLSAEDLSDFYRRMVFCRTIDERIWALNRQGKVPIAASSQGHEAAQLGSLLAAEKDGNCFLFPLLPRFGPEVRRRINRRAGHAVVHGQGG